jgi:hypothetical protein
LWKISIESSPNELGLAERPSTLTLRRAGKDWDRRWTSRNSLAEALPKAEGAPIRLVLEVTAPATYSE